MGGPSPYEGRVEVCVEGCWGTVCGIHLIVSNAFVACHQLGFSPFGKKNNAYGKCLMTIEQGLSHGKVNMETAQDQYGCTVLTAPEMNSHYSTVLFLTTMIT